MEDPHSVASKVPTPFNWSTAGPYLLEIVDIEYHRIRELIPGYMGDNIQEPIIAAFILDTIKKLDDELGWDAPRMSEESEAWFYSWIVDRRVKQHFKKRLSPPDCTAA